MKAVTFITILLIIITGCTVNSTTGLIDIKNQSDTAVGNIKIGDSIICSYISPGTKYSYYFTNELAGKLSAESAVSGYYSQSEEDEVKEDGNYKLKTNYWFSCIIDEQNGDIYIRIFCNNEQGKDRIEDDYEYDSFYKD